MSVSKAKKIENMSSPRLEKLTDMMFKKHWQITFRVIGITVVMIVIFGGGGYLLDQRLGTGPAGLIFGLILAYPIAQLVIYKVFKKLTK